MALQLTEHAFCRNQPAQYKERCLLRLHLQQQQQQLFGALD
jgi:hypothetical protein